MTFWSRLMKSWFHDHNQTCVDQVFIKYPPGGNKKSRLGEPRPREEFCESLNCCVHVSSHLLTTLHPWLSLFLFSLFIYTLSRDVHRLPGSRSASAVSVKYEEEKLP